MELNLYKSAISGFHQGMDPFGSWSLSTGDSGGQVSTIH